MAFTVTQLHPHIGAEIGGLDLREPIDAAAVEALWRAIDNHAVLVFHDQRLSDEQLRGFAARFGDLEIGRSASRTRNSCRNMASLTFPSAWERSYRAVRGN